jgi:hypothetical protein
MEKPKNIWKVYRERKLEILKLNLPPEEEHKMITALCDELGI